MLTSVLYSKWQGSRNRNSRFVQHFDTLTNELRDSGCRLDVPILIIGKEPLVILRPRCGLK